MTGTRDWSYKEENESFKIQTKHSKKSCYSVKQKKQKRKSRKRKASVSLDFYSTPEWRRLRYQVLRIHQAKCMCCGRSPKDHGVVLHVDHIKPRSKHPHLELDLNNLQVLCEDCNLGKLNQDETDWRPDI